ncbi:hypothetical protein [Nostoc sp.]|uniref:hypothetical protein n=1 Tax=Nostoc sp. TaxID=1180 RepID=UPI002FF4FA71
MFITSTNINFLEQSVIKFQSFDIDDRLTVLALLYTEIYDEIPAPCLNNVPNENTANLVAHIQNLPQAEQLSQELKLGLCLTYDIMSA